MSESPLIQTRASGWPLDHIGLGAASIEEGVAWLTERTGVEARILPPERGQWYRSAALPIGTDSSIEVLAPNPEHRGPNPMKFVLSRCRTPQLLFWYIAVRDFDAFVEAARAVGVRVEGIQRFDPPVGDGPAYDRGWLGPGFLSQRPCVIQWRRREHWNGHEGATTCALQQFELRHPDGERLSKMLGELGIPIAVETGPPGLALTIDTPRGPVTLSGEGIDFSGIGGFCRMLAMTLRSFV